MSIPAQLQASARSAYRHVWRSTGVLCAGDLNGLSIARSKLRAAYEEKRTTTDVKLYSEDVQHAKEVGDLLLRNVVQGKEKEPGHYEMKILPTTEVGSNDSIRKAKTTQRSDKDRKSPFPNRLKAAGGQRTA